MVDNKVLKSSRSRGEGAEGEVAAATPFPGNAAIYRKLSIWSSIGIHTYLFFGYWVIKHFLAGEQWPTSWTPVVVALISTIWFARLMYRWIMRLDAQYGRGGGWELVSTKVKLPRIRERSKGKRSTLSEHGSA